MFDRSRARICIRTADSSAALAALARYYRKWGYTATERIPAHLKQSGSQVVRQVYWRSADGQCPWLTFVMPDIENAFSTGYALAKALPDIPVIVVRTYIYGDVQLKAYLDKDCILKVGDDPDHELAWLPIPLERERVDKLSQQLGARPAFSQFLEEVLDGRVNHHELELGLNLRPLSHGFVEVQQGEDQAWQHSAWIKAA